MSAGQVGFLSHPVQVFLFWGFKLRRGSTTSRTGRMLPLFGFRLRTSGWCGRGSPFRRRSFPQGQDRAQVLADRDAPRSGANPCELPPAPNSGPPYWIGLRESQKDTHICSFFGGVGYCGIHPNACCLSLSLTPLYGCYLNLRTPFCGKLHTCSQGKPATCLAK